MADAFSHFDTKDLLKAKRILFLGDSNIRAQYKDLVWLLNSNTLIDKASLRSKLEFSYLGDYLINRSQLNHGRDVKEARKYSDKNNGTIVEYIFITRCYNRDVEDLFKAIRQKSRPVPNVIVVNSCLWDLTRWGPNGVPQYKDNMVRLMRVMKQSLPRECLVIWTTALPPASHVRGGLLIKQIEFMESLLKFEVMEANTFARDVVVNHGFDLLDNHYHTRMQMHRRAKDGIHYMPVPVRLMTNLLLTHLALSWGRDLPGNIKSVLLDKAIALDSKPAKEASAQIPTDGIFSKLNQHSPVVPRTVGGFKITFNPNDETAARQCKQILGVSDYQGTQGCEQQSCQDESKHKDYAWEQQGYNHQQRNQASNYHGGPYRRQKRRNKRNPYHGNYYNYRY